MSYPDYSRVREDNAERLRRLREQQIHDEERGISRVRQPFQRGSWAEMFEGAQFGSTAIDPRRFNPSTAYTPPPYRPGAAEQQEAARRPQQVIPKLEDLTVSCPECSWKKTVLGYNKWEMQRHADELLQRHIEEAHRPRTASVDEGDPMDTFMRTLDVPKPDCDK